VTPTGSPSLRLGTRGSALALAQSGMIADDLRALGAAVELVVIRTTGDDRPPNTIWGEGAFVMALEAALLDGRIDVAVHSAKDVPTARIHALSSPHTRPARTHATRSSVARRGAPWPPSPPARLSGPIAHAERPSSGRTARTCSRGLSTATSTRASASSPRVRPTPSSSPSPA
jgi:hydroxymethylbilane synthase